MNCVQTPLSCDAQAQQEMISYCCVTHIEGSLNVLSTNPLLRAMENNLTTLKEAVSCYIVGRPWIVWNIIVVLGGRLKDTKIA